MAPSLADSANKSRLKPALAASTAIHCLLLAGFATHAGLPGSPGHPVEQIQAQAPLQATLRKIVAQPDPKPTVAAALVDAAGPAAAAKAAVTGDERGPLPLHPIAAAYPEGALAMGISAKVEVRALVDETGRVEQASVVSSTLADVFDRSALTAVQATRFVPATAAGRPVKSSYRAVIFYDIK